MAPTHYFFAPHPDDAALSCGGQIATLARNGETPVIVTVMAGDSPALEPPPPHIAELWARWGLGSGSAVSATRRAEDSAAAARLGARVEFWPWLDAIYRHDPLTGDFLYAGKDAIFGDIAPTDLLVRQCEPGANDATILDFVARLQAGDTLHSPLGVGNHIDHRLVRTLLQTLAREQPTVNLFCYDEYPYSAPDYKGIRAADAVQTALDQAERAFAVTARRATISVRQAIVHSLDSAALDVKIAAVACYQSQISSFWADTGAMADSVRRYTEQVGGEREWRFSRDRHPMAQSADS